MLEAARGYRRELRRVRDDQRRRGRASLLQRRRSCCPPAGAVDESRRMKPQSAGGSTSPSARAVLVEATRRETTSTEDVGAVRWLLGLQPPVDPDRSPQPGRRVAAPTQTCAVSEQRRGGDRVTRALNDARDTLQSWIASGREWPQPAMGGRTVPAQPAPQPEPDPPAAAVCKHTGLRAGDRVRTWPYDGDPVAVRGTEVEAGAGTVWVLPADGSATASHRVRPAAYGCPVCGACEARSTAPSSRRPCSDCLRDLRRLSSDRPRAPASARRSRLVRRRPRHRPLPRQRLAG
jgi:hypothetical protein